MNQEQGIDMTRLTMIAALALAACTEAPKPDPTRPDPQPRPAAAMDVAVEISGVTLADDCGDAAPPPARPAIAPAAKAASVDASEPRQSQSRSPRGPSAGGCADPSNCHGPSVPHHECEQTSMQLSLRGTAGPGPTTVKVKQVELLDAGKVVGQLTARKPSRWDDQGNYVTWDETVAPGKTLATSYVLSSPDWNAIAGGRYGAQGKLFTLRVTVTVGTPRRPSRSSRSRRS
jgi:hypothetical protein